LLARNDLLDDAGLFENVERACLGLGGEQAAEIRSAFLQVFARVLEMRLLADEVLREIARYPDTYLARAEAIVSARIRALGLHRLLDEDDARHVARLLLAGSPPRSGAEVVGDALVASLFRSLRLGGQMELRCACCGFHFRRRDLSSERGILADQVDLLFASDLGPHRRRDRFKPPEKTALHVDHVVPRIGFGPTRSDNLQVLCEFCNTGKLIYRRALECAPICVAGSAPPLDSFPPPAVRRQSVVAALMRYRRCCSCRRGPDECELTVRPTEAWFVPWTLAVYCYECAPDE
jgi:hypothetical protein